MEYPKRKHPRLKNYDYSQPGYYYVTIHTASEGAPLSQIGKATVFADPKVTLLPAGKIAREQLLLLESKYPNVRIDKYIIMPTHIHAIIQLLEDPAGASPRPTLMDIVCAYKSLVTRYCNRMLNTPGQRLFQASFYETVLRNEQAYQECWRYIEENPKKWSLDPEDL